MLVLTRRDGESVLIGDALVTVQAVHGGAVKVLIDAPKSVRIARAELLTDEERELREVKDAFGGRGGK
jgi:carbon storage regulator